MSRSLLGLLVLLVAACTPTPAPTVRPTAAPPSTEAATFGVTGSGKLCGPWWFGCGAVLVIEQSGWTLPAGWTPRADDIVFAVDLRTGSERPARVTGVAQAGAGWIEPGDYLLVGVLTRKPDSPADAALQSSIGCSMELNVPVGTDAVTVDLKFRGGCTIAVSIDGATAAPGASPS